MHLPPWLKAPDNQAMPVARPNHLVFVIFDSARFDHVEVGKTPWLDKLGALERRFSYASWTAPSHLTYLMGQLPHLSPRKVFASEVYRREFMQWSTRLGIDGMSFKSFVPHLSLPRVLKVYGYETHAMVSMPVLNPQTPFSLFFDTYELMPSHNEFHAMIEKLEFPEDIPQFYFLNVGETHYPYRLQGEKDLPRLHGLHGVFKHMDDFVANPQTDAQASRFFSDAELRRLKDKQIECVEYLDGLLERLYARCPENTHLIVTSDHGELFGEDGYFGHGPIMHEKVFEIPFTEGRVPR